MAHLRSIVAVVTDPFAKEQLAASKAAAIARRARATLTLLNTFMVPQPVADVPMGSHAQIIESAKRQRRVQLEKLAAKWRKQGIKTQVLVEWDYPAHEAAIRAVLRQKPDLLVMHSHRHGRLARWVLANTDWELIRHCPCPVWFVREPKLPQRPALLVAVDPFHANAKPARLDERLLGVASTVARRLGGAIGIAHAYRAPIASTSGTLMEPFRFPSAAYAVRDEAGKVAAAVRSLGLRHEIPAERCYVVEGEPAATITRIVKQRKTDVLVMGAVSRTAVARTVIGNTAEKVLDDVDCDVLVVKPARFKTSIARARPR